ncbi:MAG: peptide chain release factor N(5)-glutamine methyltransferase [Clostridia bacterium]
MQKTVADLYMHYKAVLNSEIEARELIAHSLNLDRKQIFNWSKTFVTQDDEKKVLENINKRQKGMPLAYILGEWEFYSLPFKVDENVLIPRSDTETLVDSALEYLREQSHRHMDKMKILDLCAGSGCIGIAIGKNYQNSTIFACDISKKAIDIAKENAKINNIVNYTIYEDNVLDPKIKYPIVDLIVSNPPYIETKTIDTLDCDVRDFEPRIALDGGEDGLIFYEKICEKYLGFLKYGGKIIFEYGIHQEDDIKQILEKYKFENIKITKDLCGINRIIEATKYNID